MITEYQSGAAFLEDNRAFLDTQPYMTMFFQMDSPLLRQADQTNYALKCEKENQTLLALKVEPYNMLLFGGAACVPELLRFIMDGGYEMKNYLCETGLGETVAEELREKYGAVYREGLAMDFMEADTVTEPSSPEVEPARSSDADEIFEYMKRFIADCGLLDKPDYEHTKKTIGSFRVIRENGRIVSTAKSVPSSGRNRSITNVYTPDDCRGKGYARKVVNTLKNEILASGKTVTLNVDKHNPVTNHLYRSIGFKRVFSQSEYRRV